MKGAPQKKSVSVKYHLKGKIRRIARRKQERRKSNKKIEVLLVWYKTPSKSYPEIKIKIKAKPS